MGLQRVKFDFAIPATQTQYLWLRMIHQECQHLKTEVIWDADVAYTGELQLSYTEGLIRITANTHGDVDYVAAMLQIYLQHHNFDSDSKIEFTYINVGDIMVADGNPDGTVIVTSVTVAKISSAETLVVINA